VFSVEGYNKGIYSGCYGPDGEPKDSVDQDRSSQSTRMLSEYLVHFHRELNHQGKGNVLLFPVATQTKNRVDGSDGCKERLGGLLKYYHREAA